jgi:HlyD family secretion protein
MTTNLTLVVDEHEDVLTVPNAALRFNPPGLTSEEIAKMIQDLPPLPPSLRGAAPRGGATPGEDRQPPSGSGGEQGLEAGGRRGGRGPGGGGGRRGGGRGGGGGRNQRSVLWMQDPATLALKPIRVRLGLSDGTRTEVAGPDVKEGAEIVIGDLTQSATPAQPRPASNPLVPNLGGGRGRGF